MKIKCIQTNPGANERENLDLLESMLMAQKPTEGMANVVVLPEVFAVMGSDQLRKKSANQLGDGTFKLLAQWAKTSQHFLIAGTHAEKTNDPHKVFNTATAFSPQGTLVDVYRKIHLFNLKDTNGNPLYCESDVFMEGQESSTFTIESGPHKWHCMTIVCYDLRFPEIIRREISRSGPIDVLFVPAAFTHQTGKDHWEVLLRARAIENQCYVVACNQTGFHSEGRKRNWGHSMIIDPWGNIITALEEEVGILETTLSKDNLVSARTRIPALTDRVLLK